MDEIDAERVVGKPPRDRPLPVEMSSIDSKHQQTHSHADERFPQAFSGTDRIEAAGILRRLALQATAEQDERRK